MTRDSKNGIIVLGSGSMVGSRFCELAQNTKDLIKADLRGENQVDITNPQQVEEFFSTHKLPWTILFSAFTNVDEAEKQRGNKKGSCWKINVEGVKNVVESCRKHGTKLIFISTDFIFDGLNGPYGEDNPYGADMDKVSWYGITKIEAEKIVKELDHFLIIRISYPYRAQFKEKTDFARSIVEKYTNGSLHPMFTDQQITPTFVDDVAPAVLLLIEKDKNGIYNLASPNLATPYDFAKLLIDGLRENTTSIQEGSLKAFLTNGNTPRPVKAGLKVDKITELGFKPTTWQDGIKIILPAIKDNN